MAAMELVTYANGYTTQAPKITPIIIRAVFGQRLDFLELAAHTPQWLPIAAHAHHELTNAPTTPIMLGGYLWRRTGENQNWDHILKAGDGRYFELTLKINAKTRAYHPNLIAIEYPGETLTLWQGSFDQIERPWQIALAENGILDEPAHLDTLRPTRLHIKTDYITERPIVLADFGFDAKLPIHDPGQFDRVRSKARARPVGDTFYLHAMGGPILGRNYNKTTQCWDTHKKLPADMHILAEDIQQEIRDTYARRYGHAWYMRMEWQLCREFLHSHDWDEWRKLKRDYDTGRLWRTAMQGHDIIEPTEKNSTRCEVAEWWQHIRDSWTPGDTQPQLPPPPADWTTLAKSRASIDARIAALALYETGEIIDPETITYQMLEEKTEQEPGSLLQQFKQKVNEQIEKLNDYKLFHKLGNLLGLCYSQPAVGIAGASDEADATPQIT